MKTTSLNTKLENIVQYISEEANNIESNLAESAISLNPSFTWAKFILTDDLPNENKQRVPKEEFANLIKTGIHAPFKMAEGGINRGHEDSRPLGVITHLKEVGNKIEGLAALWTREREGDITQLKDMFNNGTLPQLSWEIMYEDSSVDDEGVENLKGTALRAITAVGMPAYAGRTPVVALASQAETQSEELNVEELDQLKKELEELKASLTAKESELTTLTEELTQLREYKSGIEKEQADASKLTNIKQKFIEAGIQKDETYFTDKRELLLGMNESQIEFMVQEMAAFASIKTSSASTNTTTVPPIVNEEVGLIEDPKVLAKKLRASLVENQ